MELGIILHAQDTWACKIKASNRFDNVIYELVRFSLDQINLFINFISVYLNPIYTIFKMLIVCTLPTRIQYGIDTASLFMS